MTLLKKWVKKYADSITYYTCASLTGLAGMSMLISYASDKSEFGSFPVGSLYLLSISIPLGIFAHYTAKKTKIKYHELNDEIDLRGFSEQLLIECTESTSTRNLVEIIAEEKQLTEEYKTGKKAIGLLSYLSTNSF
jgi:hypothetical protein